MTMMKSWIQISIAIMALLVPANLYCQLICNPPEICSCDKEKVSPNLTIANPVKLTGALYDATGEPIRFNRTVIQVRDAENNKVLLSAVLDEEGRFDLGTVPAGRFRLIAMWEKEHEVARLPLFDQPKPVSCSGENGCHLQIVLALHGTDQRFESCPPK
jgi:hypothetical protein